MASSKHARLLPHTRLSDMPNVGPATVADFEKLGIREPRQLAGRDAYELYEKLCRLTKRRHDPCVIDVFLAAVDFAGGAPARPWWHYTARRKQRVTTSRAGLRRSTESTAPRRRRSTDPPRR